MHSGQRPGKNERLIRSYYRELRDAFGGIKKTLKSSIIVLTRTIRLP